MTRSYRLLAERGQLPQGIVSLGVYDEDPSAAEVFGLYVVPEARGTGVSWRLVEAAAALATQNGYGQLYYWVGTDNGRAIGFAKNFGFRLAATAVHHAPRISSWGSRRWRWSCRWSPTPHQCRTRRAGRQQPGRARPLRTGLVAGWLLDAKSGPSTGCPGPRGRKVVHGCAALTAFRLRSCRLTYAETAPTSDALAVPMAVRRRRLGRRHHACPVPLSSVG